MTIENNIKKTPAYPPSEDIAYTINHAIACTVTDFIDPFVGKWTQDYLGKRFSIGCGHNHADDHHHGHHHGHDHAHGHEACEHTHHKDKAKFSHWWAGELAGDFGAVPVTVALQYYAPAMLNGIGAVLKPVIGGFFESGAKKAARKWAHERGIDPQSEEAKAQAALLYDYEMHHLPQALVWTASSIAINLGTQRAMGNHAPLSHMLAGKAAGASITAAAVVAARGIMPAAARKWDTFTTSKIFQPATEMTAGWFGVDVEDTRRMLAKEAQIKHENWQDRVRDTPAATSLKP